MERLNHWGHDPIGDKTRRESAFEVCPRNDLDQSRLFGFELLDNEAIFLASLVFKWMDLSGSFPGAQFNPEVVNHNVRQASGGVSWSEVVSP
jgi:hypothetical protein